MQPQKYTRNYTDFSIIHKHVFIKYFGESDNGFSYRRLIHTDPKKGKSVAVGIYRIQCELNLVTIKSKFAIRFLCNIVAF